MNKGLLRKVLSRNVVAIVLHYCTIPMTGYDILQRIIEDFGVLLTPAVFYTCLKRLKRDGMLDSAVVDGKNGRKATRYVVTDEGRACLVESVQELRFMLKVLEKRLV